MKTCVIGAGWLGGTVGRNWVRAGHEVMFSTPHPEKLAASIKALGARSSTCTPREAAAFGPVVLIATPYKHLTAIGRDFAAELDGKIVLDATNPGPIGGSEYLPESENIRGGVQGIGQVLMEQVVYDPANGQLLSASFMDYAVPRADNLIMFETRFNEVLTTTNPFDAKGVGEAGTVAAIPTVMNAINDALAHAGAAEMDMPATPQRGWQALQKAGTLAA